MISRASEDPTQHPCSGSEGSLDPQAERADPDPSAPRPPSCRRFMGYAVTLAALFLIAHVAGFREYTGVLSGALRLDWRAFGGAAYLLLYAAWVFVVPPLLIAAALTKLWGVWARRA